MNKSLVQVRLLFLPELVLFLLTFRVLTLLFFEDAESLCLTKHYVFIFDTEEYYLWFL